jgi:hypothetical protein
MPINEGETTPVSTMKTVKNENEYTMGATTPVSTMENCTHD